jgi:hypothetical protein
MKSKYKILILFLLISNLILLYCHFNNLSIVKDYRQQLKILTPRFSSKDTIQLLNEILNIKEFDWDTKLLDTSWRVSILKYPYLRNEYPLFKFNKKIVYFEGKASTWDNEFMFGIFNLYPNDSAYIFFEFNTYRAGAVEAKKVKNKWKIIEYYLGRK